MGFCVKCCAKIKPQKGCRRHGIFRKEKIMDQLEKELQKIAKHFIELHKDIVYDTNKLYKVLIPKHHELSSSYAYYCHLNGMEFEFYDKEIVKIVEKST